jgi:hypothetical protein
MGVWNVKEPWITKNWEIVRNAIKTPPKKKIKSAIRLLLKATETETWL